MNALAIAALVTWLAAGVLDLYVLGPSLFGHRTDGGRAVVPAPVLFGHLGLALCGLASWISFVMAGPIGFAWLAIALLGGAIGLGFPIARRQGSPGGWSRSGGSDAAQPAIFGITSDEMLARALEDEALTTKLVDDLLANVMAAPAPGPRWSVRRPSAFAIAAHGALAMTTFLVAVVAAVTASAS